MKRITVLGSSMLAALLEAPKGRAQDLVLPERELAFDFDTSRSDRKRKRYSDRPRVARVAGPNGFTYHVKRDGQTVSSHTTQAEALAALKAGAR